MTKRGKTFSILALVIATIVASGLFIGYATLHTAGVSYYGNGNAAALDKYTNYTSELADTVNEGKAATESDDLTPVGFFTKGTISAAKKFLNSVGLFIKIGRDLAGDITGFPSWAIDMFALIMIAWLVAVTINLILRSQEVT